MFDSSVKAGQFNVEIDYPTSNGSRFQGTEKAYYDITGTGITAESFEQTSAGGGGNISPSGPYAAAAVQGIPPNGSKSGSIAANSFTDPPGGGAVPEPASLALLGSGVIGLVGYAWRRRRG